MIDLPDEAATHALGRDIARTLQAFDAGLVVSLAGELGAGKTALTRATLRALGVTGPVVSPSYTLLEPYELAGDRHFLHMDLYRLADAEELEFIGIRDINPHQDWVFIEWAEQGEGFLPAIDVDIRLHYNGSGRRADIAARSCAGHAWHELLIAHR